MIGFPYYSDYKFILKIVLLSATIGTLIATVFSEIVSPSGVWYNSITKCLEAVLGVIPSAFMIITLVFAFCYHKGIDISLKNDFDFDNLPPVPDKSKKISKVDPILCIVFSIALFVILMVAPQILGIVFIKNDTASGIIPVFSTEAIRSSWVFIVVLTACCVVSEAIRLIEGRECKKVMVSTIITNVIMVITSAIWLLGTNIMNPEFLREASIMFTDNELFVNISANFQVFILGLIVLASFIETVVTVVKTLKK